MYHLDIPKTRQYDHGKVEVIARSSVGEARTETTLTVKPRSDDYRGVLKNSPRRKFATSENTQTHTETCRRILCVSNLTSIIHAQLT